jgi:hypothetical protein
MVVRMADPPIANEKIIPSSPAKQKKLRGIVPTPIRHIHKLPWSGVASSPTASSPYFLARSTSHDWAGPTDNAFIESFNGKFR